MKIVARLATVGGVAALIGGAGLASLGAVAGASPLPSAGGGGTVFVQTDNLAANQVVAYHRGRDGSLTETGVYPTGGLGGQLSGSVVDHLASEGSLAYDRAGGLLLAVNAGSNTVSVFSVEGGRLALRQVVASGGAFPVSVATHGDSAYVLNAEDGGSVQGYTVGFHRLIPRPGSSRALGLDPSATPQFTNTPGQVAFTPSGSQLVVTTKANGNDIDVFPLDHGGRIVGPATVNSEPGAVPFGVTFNRLNQVVVGEAGPSAVATFRLTASGALKPIDSLNTGQAATCWVSSDGPFVYASNAGSADVSTDAVSPGGRLSSLGLTTTDPGTVDAAVSPNGHFLYVQTGGNGIVDAYRVGAHGGLTEVGSVTVPGAIGGEGIVAL